ncbi:MAG: HAMP domain-containing histidine kinase [Deltaproteobacteria bacterium]|nr:HAMP domain-containing histidine kinase [Deltaproteobacteria bacterium]
MLERKSFRTKVARRIFTLYILCAILPVLALATVSYIIVKDQLQVQSQKRLHREAKALGLSIYDKLSLLSAEMKILCSNLDHYTSREKGNSAQDLTAEWGGRFTSLGVIKPGGGYDAILGDKRKVPTFSEPEARHIRSGKVLLLDEAVRGKRPRLFLFLGSAHEHPKQGILMAEIRGSYFWEVAEGRPPLSEFSVLGPTKEVLFSTSPIPPTVLAQVHARASDTHSGYFKWERRDDTFYASYWALFLEANYLAPQWVIVLGEPEEVVFGSMASFKMYFPMILFLSLGMVFLLSINSIRKSMGPIEILKEATQKVAEGDFGHVVEIDTEDEFENLGDSFNEMSKRLEETQDLLTRTAKMSTMGQMAAGIFHEVKQPLSAISGLLQLSMREDRSEKEKKRLKTIMLAVNRLNTILESFKSFSRTSEEKYEGIFIHLVLDQIVELFRHQLKGKSIECIYEKAKSIHPVLGDDQSLQQVFSNLIMNAADALEEKGSGKRAIRIAIFEKTDNVIVEIEDNGCGISKEVKEKLFDPFFSTKGPTKGTGLGMSIVESILHRHNATIDLYSEVGVGSKFTLTFPALATIPRPADKSDS